MFKIKVKREPLVSKSASSLVWPQSESELLYNWRSVSQYVLVSCPIWDFWPEIFFFESYSIVLFGASSLTSGRVCHLSVFWQYSLK
jgi:hypothetical protein